MNDDIIELINRRRHQVLVHSYIYYKLGDCIIDDYTWSMWAKELYDLQNEYPEEAEKAPFNNIFKDFDYSTGADLAFDECMPWLHRRATNLLTYARNKLMQQLEKYDKLYGETVAESLAR